MALVASSPTSDWDGKAASARNRNRRKQVSDAGLFLWATDANKAFAKGLLARRALREKEFAVGGIGRGLGQLSRNVRAIG